MYVRSILSNYHFPPKKPQKKTTKKPQCLVESMLLLDITTTTMPDRQTDRQSLSAMQELCLSGLTGIPYLPTYLPYLSLAF